MVLTRNSSRDNLPFEAFYIPSKFLKKAEDELKENPENKSLAIKKLKEIILKEKGLSCRTTDEFLLLFLRARKFNIPNAFNLLKKCMCFKAKNPNIFTTMMNYDSMVKLIKSKALVFLPYRCSDGCAVLAVHINNWNPAEVHVDDVKRMLFLYLFHSAWDPLTQINGYKVIIDVKSNPLRHLRYCTPQIIYLLYSGTQECFPGRFKAFHVVNTSIVFKTGWALVQPFLSEKLRKRFIFHQNNDGLKKYFDESILPEDFGGTLEESDCSEWLHNAVQEEPLMRFVNS